MKLIFRMAIALLASLCFQVKAAPGEVLMGVWDLDGSGSTQQVWNSLVRTGVYKIRVQSNNGSSYEYFVEIGGYSPSWSLVNVSDLNGQPGAELAIIFTYRDTATALQIISHRTKTSKIHYVLPPSGGLNFSLVTVADFDGLTGNELLLNVAYQNGGREYQIVHMQNTSITKSTYPFNSGESIIILNNGIVNTNGNPGSEILVNRGGNNVYVIRDRDRSTSSYSMTGNTWKILGSSDLDGIPGDEVVISNGAYVHVINDVTRSTRQLYVGNPPWTLYGFSNTDGMYGNEILITLNGSLKTLKYR
jgi:hypothetical protein